MSAVYHILDKIPLIDPTDVQIEYEALANDLVKSGRLRIDTDHHANFARFSDPAANISLMVSKEELTTPELLPYTKENFRFLYGNKITQDSFEKKINIIFKDLKKQISKLQPVPLEVTIKLARIFVQSAHPIIIKWLLHDRVEVFITYSHNIGDMMNIQDWKHSGSNSGMQSTDGKSVAIFVSCGGDPFGQTSLGHPTYGDGWPAMARLQIIAGQELGHFADIMRDTKGRQISRHSANLSGTQATEHTKTARRYDIKNCDDIFSTLLHNGMNELIKYEEKLKFYRKNKIKNLITLWLKILQYIYKKKLVSFADRNELFFVRKFVNDRYMSLMIKTMIEDMKLNLCPKAEVYKRDNQEEEEAIACIEALARVPQQVMKWGYLTTRATMKHLYKIYYEEVIPSLIFNYSAMTGYQYKRNYVTPKKTFKSLLNKYNIFRQRNNKIISVREI